MRILVPLATFVIGLAIGSLAILYTSGQSSGSGLEGSSSTSGSEWFSYVGGKRLTVATSTANFAASPKWAPGNPLPLRPEEAILRAQESLQSLGSPAADWPFSEIALSNAQPFDANAHEYLYTVLFQPNNPPFNLHNGLEGARLLVYFNGKVVLPVPSNGSAP